MDQVQKNKVELLETIRKYGEIPIDPARSAFLANCWAAYKALCMIDKPNTVYAYEAEPHNTSRHFTRQMAEEWTAGMKNADDTQGPHFSMDRVKEIMKEHHVDHDPVEFYAALNSVYSDFSEALKENNASNMKLYVCLAKAWIDDPDAVSNKAAAYYTYVVKH